MTQSDGSGGRSAAPRLRGADHLVVPFLSVGPPLSGDDTGRGIHLAP